MDEFYIGTRVWFPAKDSDRIEEGYIYKILFSCLGTKYEVVTNVQHRGKYVTILTVSTRKENEIFTSRDEAVDAKIIELKDKIKEFQKKIELLEESKGGR